MYGGLFIFGRGFELESTLSTAFPPETCPREATRFNPKPIKSTYSLPELHSTGSGDSCVEVVLIGQVALIRRVSRCQEQPIGTEKSTANTWQEQGHANRTRLSYSFKAKSSNYISPMYHSYRTTSFKATKKRSVDAKYQTPYHAVPSLVPDTYDMAISVPWISASQAPEPGSLAPFHPVFA